MKLRIRREQAIAKGGFLGGGDKLQFRLHLQLELSDEERNLAEKYSAAVPNIFIIPYSDPEGRPPKRYDPNNPEGGISWRALVAGIVVPSTSIGTIVKYENEAKTGIESLKNVLDVAKNYGGEEFIDY